MNETPNSIAAISRVGGMTGPTSDPAWLKLVINHGELDVENLVNSLHQKYRQPVTVAEAHRAFADRAKLFAEENESDGLPLPRPPTTPPPAPASSEPVESPPTKLDDRTINETRVAVIARMELRKISRAAAAEEIGISPGMFGQFFRYEPIPSTLVAACIRWLATPYTDPQDQTMNPPAPHPLIAQMMNEIKARKITITEASHQIGIHESATYKARTTGRLTPIMEQKITEWIAPAPTSIEKKPEITFEKAVFKKADGEQPTKLTPRQLYQVDDLVDVAIDRGGINANRTYLTMKMKALAISIERLTHEKPREAATLARMFADLADQQADENEHPSMTFTAGPTTVSGPTWKGGVL